MSKLSYNANQIVLNRYSKRNTSNVPYEDWDSISRRVAETVGKAEKGELKREYWTNIFYELLSRRIFIPNTPCLVNAGKPAGEQQLAACFVLPIEDRLEAILETAKQAGLIHRSGGGTGFSFENLRPAGAELSSGGTASGPVSFMEIFNTITETIKQGGVRRGANMAVLRVDHPDILQFIHMKNNQTRMTNFNISVTVTDEFMDAVEGGEWYRTKFNGNDWDKDIINPLTGNSYVHDMYHKYHVGALDGDTYTGKLYAPDVWRRIIESAHKYAEPGVIFIDTVNKSNPLKNTLGDILTSNPCGEQMLHAYNSCNLGSIDISKFVTSGFGKPVFQEDSFCDAIHRAVRFLDNVIDVCDWPLTQIDQVVKRTRPIGLGIMGFADTLIKLGIRYGSEESKEFARNIGDILKRSSILASVHLGTEKGSFPDYNLNRSNYLTQFDRLRNYQITTIAPTGTISLVAETSSGIEPNFDWVYIRKDTIGERAYLHPLVANQLKIKVDWQDPDSIMKAAKEAQGRLYELPDYFVTAHDLSAKEHVEMLATWQPYIDNSISKTCNGAKSDTVDDVDSLYKLAYKLRCKAVSYYRDGSRDGQVLTSLTKESDSKGGDPVSQPDGAASAKPIIEKSVPVFRPAQLSGKTWKFNLEQEPLYITVNHNGSSILEVFAIGPISSSVGLLISKMLRGRFSTKEVVSILRKKNGNQVIWFNKKCCTTPEQLIAECILLTEEELSSSSVSLPVQYEAKNEDKVLGKQCPFCQGELRRINGCDLCVACGASKCG